LSTISPRQTSSHVAQNTSQEAGAHPNGVDAVGGRALFLGEAIASV
jgi:hypothetical protein